ncbi:hypothetical protein ACOSQ2_007086 [Xanthoceras sorbifolium]
MMQGVELTVTFELVGLNVEPIMVHDSTSGLDYVAGPELMDQGLSGVSDQPKTNIRKWKQAARVGPSAKGLALGGHSPV